MHVGIDAGAQTYFCSGGGGGGGEAGGGGGGGGRGIVGGGGGETIDEADACEEMASWWSGGLPSP